MSIHAPSIGQVSPDFLTIIQLEVLFDKDFMSPISCFCYLKGFVGLTTQTQNASFLNARKRQRFPMRGSKLHPLLWAPSLRCAFLERHVLERKRHVRERKYKPDSNTSDLGMMRFRTLSSTVMVT